MYTYIHTHTVCMYVYVHTYKATCMHAYIRRYIYTHTCIHTYLHTVRMWLIRIPSWWFPTIRYLLQAVVVGNFYPQPRWENDLNTTFSSTLQDSLCITFEYLIIWIPQHQPSLRPYCQYRGHDCDDWEYESNLHYKWVDCMYYHLALLAQLKPP